MSLLLVRNNSLVEELRYLTLIELYLRFTKNFVVSIIALDQLNCPREMQKNTSSHFFYLSLKHATIDLRFKSFSDAVKHEAVLTCANNVFVYYRAEWFIWFIL